MEKELDEIKERLKITESHLIEERNARNSISRQVWSYSFKIEFVTDRKDNDNWNSGCFRTPHGSKFQLGWGNIKKNISETN